MTEDSRTLRKKLRKSGISAKAIDASWPDWWTDQAEGSESAQMQLRFSIARNLGLSPQTLFDDETPRFAWWDDVKFKGLREAADSRNQAIAAYGLALGRMLLGQHADNNTSLVSQLVDPDQLRRAILKNVPYVTLPDLLALCWAVGIPVLHLELFPLDIKAMKAMTVRIRDSYAIFIAFDARHHARTAFLLAHEIGHIGLGHIGNEAVIVDYEDHSRLAGSADLNGPTSLDHEEQQADQYAMQLMTGRKDAMLQLSTQTPLPSSLASASVQIGEANRIDPEMLALMFGNQTDQWPLAYKALQYLYAKPPRSQLLKPAELINRIADQQLEWDSIRQDSQSFLHHVMGLQAADR